MLINSIRKLLASSGTSNADGIARGLEALDAKIAEGRKALEEAQSRRGSALLAGDAEVTRNRAAIAAARDDLDDMLAARPLVAEQLAAARQAEAEAAATAAYEAAKAASEEAAKALRSEYEPSIRKLRGLVRKVEQARALVEAAHANLPAGASYLPDPEEAVRGRKTYPREVSERIVERWFACGTGSQNPLPRDRESELTITGDRTATMLHQQSNPATGGKMSVTWHYELREVVEVTTRPGVDAGDFEVIRKLRLPGLRLGDGIFEPARFDASPRAVLAALDAAEAERAPASTPRPEPIVTYRAVPTEPGPRAVPEPIRMIA